jgi:hypothetical protein
LLVLLGFSKSLDWSGCGVYCASPKDSAGFGMRLIDLLSLFGIIARIIYTS